MKQARDNTSNVIGVTDLQRRFRPIFDEVAHKGQSYVLTRGSRPEAALIPYAAFDRAGQVPQIAGVQRAID